MLHSVGADLKHCEMSAFIGAFSTARLRPNNNPTDCDNAPLVYSAISPNVLTIDTRGYEDEIRDITTNLASGH